MKYLIVFLLLFPFLLCSNATTCFEDEDPALFHHVNVITGHLNLCFQDVEVEGGLPLSITRTYSSSGAFDATILSDPIFDKGWTIFPHLRMELYGNTHGPFDDTLKIYLLEKGGAPVKYVSKKVTKHHNYLYPVSFSKKGSGSLSSRKNPEKNYIEIDIKEKAAILYASDGSVRHYREGPNCWYHLGAWYLELEILPSKHRIVYHYENGQLSLVELQNPTGTKVLAAVTFDREQTENDTILKADTSDGKALTYQMFSFKGKDYLKDISSNCRPREHYSYEDGRRGIGARVSAMAFGGKDQFSVTYYLPSDEKEEKKWAHKIPKKNYSADKVHILKAPVGPNGALIPIAEFTYYEEFTDIRDVDRILTRYHHTNNKLNAIEYFDKNDKVYSVLKFFWEKENLRTKALFHSSGKPLFAKTFKYDNQGNVIAENFFGSFTGNAHSPLTIDKDGKAEGAECISKSYKYTRDLICEEHESSGTTTYFEYVPDTDLLTAKFTSAHGAIFLREFYTYDTDHLLIQEIVDDGYSKNKDDLTGVTERHIKAYERSPHNGLCLSLTESYLDFATKKERQLIKRAFTYSPRCQIWTETLFDTNNKQRYTLNTDYNSNGHIILKTTPLGYQNTYDYDSLGNLIKSNEVGKLQQKIDYDNAGRPIRCTESDCKGYTKITRTSYDPKGRPLLQIDSKGNSTTQTYDTFGNCIEIHFSEALDENQEPYTPIATFTHDIHGNLISHTDPQGHCTETTYNTLRKPIKIKYPDGEVIYHIYNLNGTLAKTTHPDGTEDHYYYDDRQRMRTKFIFSANKELLSKESWDYNTFRLRFHTNAVGLKTIYTYDEAGRKIKEQAEDRVITYSYDAIGNLERTTQGGYTQVALHDLEGNVVKQWEQDRVGTIENLTTFFYNSENRKEKAIRLTSQGEATDTFAYDPEGRLSQHTDPHGETTKFDYSEETTNDLGQKVLTKVTTDQLGNITTETFDALNRLVQIEKKGPNHETVSKELILYDRAGNTAERLTTIYQETDPIKTYSIQWQYDSRGRVLKEINNHEKTTTYTYDKKGRLRIKQHPNGTTLAFSYDSLDRIKDLNSTDNMLHYQYDYGPGPSPTRAHDKVRNLSWTRTYNKFGELTSETAPTGTHLTWDYDNLGKCYNFTLPDCSRVEYIYNELHLTEITRFSPTGEEQYVHSYTHFDKNGRVHQEELIHNLGALTTTHDLLERLSKQISPWNTGYIDYGPSGLVREVDSTLFPSKEYEYDPLEQLQQEGNQTYSFDSLGNPTNAQVNTLNQISTIADTTLIYDANGNPSQRIKPDGITLYTYDALNRLTTIEKPGQPKVTFFYDPFSRLYAKKADTIYYYLYDQDTEIGLLNEQNKILELKVLGLGIEGDIGAAVALELYGQVYAPLHDFSGNIVGIVSDSGEIVEKYEISAFGQEQCSSIPINPWRFNSKRSIEGFVFFGQRFYDPQLGRWLTPDPAGSIDSPNLYLYVRNSPLNRLDLFGLDSFKMEAYFNKDLDLPKPNTTYRQNRFIPLRVTIDNVQVDCLITSNSIHKFKLTPEELAAGKVDIAPHFHEMVPSNGHFIGLTSVQNGIRTSLNELEEMSHSVMNLIGNEDHILIALHNPSDGFFKDVWETSKERRNIDTPIASVTRQVLITISESLHKVNPDLIHLHLGHSEAGAIYKCAFNGMTPDQQDLLRTHVYFLGVAPASPISKKQALFTYNFYSRKDAITGTFGKHVQASSNKTDYAIEFVTNSTSSRRKEHSFLGETCQETLKTQFKEVKRKHKFYGQSR